MGTERTTDTVAGAAMAAWGVPGRTPAVVCVHGAGVTSRQMAPLLSAFDGRTEAWAVDLPGFGSSDAGGRRWTVPDLADALVEWTRERGLTDPCLLGLSLGTQVVAEAAARHSQDVGSVVLVGPTTDPEARSMPRLALRLLWNNLYEPPSVVTQSLRDYRETGPGRAARSWTASRDHRIELVLPDVPQPALVVRGSKDRVCPGPWAEDAARLLPRGRLVTVPGQPHALSWASPGRLARLVERFLAEGRG
ncbi:pimeloyl-ACP methyl ester carboxylesterase [Nocardiopsis sp. Huas11]|uniref:alpha/beta fold hydrolase n=1 Tax=Nocardiopsis sp. Huas11 TaxID=2183912 RepID=UPI000EB1A989|nr:alpha/beta hydrolase [Nocardiopsis sp. Huas11]RKS06982.1 pimeloyl-ACP methyl ester carboxylesterase [Nocardiopsis sp. Huas11]